MIRTRFAPSPTGYLHIGGARTAFYCWLFARQQQGTFILRIEDTDLERSTPDSVQAILESMQWLGLDFDEGPFYQTQHLTRYQAIIDLLLTEKKAYRCYCSKERLGALRAEQMANKQKPRYDGHCRELTELKPAPFVVRFKNPQDGNVEFNDVVRGTIRIANQELDDLIIARSDGSPTYNFTVVVDDWDMKITHVLRGDDHINNTPRQVNILRALGANVPVYGHLPMILGSDGKRLSKRHGAVGVMQYRSDGFLPQALLNYLARLGWSYGDQEIFSRDELIQFFDVNKISKSPAIFNTDKLLWLNHHYIKTLPAEDLVPELTWHLQRLGVNVATQPTMTDIIFAQRERCKTLKEMAEKSRFFYDEIQLDASSIPADVQPALSDFAKKVLALDIWSKENIHLLLQTTADNHQQKMGKLAQPLRLLLTGSPVSPPVDITLFLLGKEKIQQRLQCLLQ